MPLRLERNSQARSGISRLRSIGRGGRRGQAVRQRRLGDLLDDERRPCLVRPARPAGRARRPARERSCAGSRAEPRRRPGPLAGQPRPARLRDAPPAGCCRSPTDPPAGPGTTAGSAHKTAAAARAAAGGPAGRGRLRPHAAARPARPTVGVLEHGADGQLHPEAGAHPADQPRRQQRVAAQLEEMVVDAHPLAAPAPRRTGRRGLAPAASAGRGTPRPRRCGAGSALRSSLPLGVSGRASSTTNAAGTMYSGSRSARWRRRAATSGDAPGAGTT